MVGDNILRCQSNILVVGRELLEMVENIIRPTNDRKQIKSGRVNDSNCRCVGLRRHLPW